MTRAQAIFPNCAEVRKKEMGVRGTVGQRDGMWQVIMPENQSSWLVNLVGFCDEFTWFPVLAWVSSHSPNTHKSGRWESLNCSRVWLFVYPYSLCSGNLLRKLPCPLVSAGKCGESYAPLHYDRRIGQKVNNNNIQPMKWKCVLFSELHIFFGNNPGQIITMKVIIQIFPPRLQTYFIRKSLLWPIRLLLKYCECSFRFHSLVRIHVMFTPTLHHLI